MKTTAHINKNQKGFTLIELLVVIGILAILLAITLIAINPARQFGQANNTKRRSHVTQILNAIGAYTAENGGNLPADITGLTDDTATDFGSTAFTTICAQLVPDYIPALPVEPSLEQPDVEADDCAAAWDTGYQITVDANNRVTVSAPDAENGEIIQVTR